MFVSDTLGGPEQFEAEPTLQDLTDHIDNYLFYDKRVRIVHLPDGSVRRVLQNEPNPFVDVEVTSVTTPNDNMLYEYRRRIGSGSLFCGANQTTLNWTNFSDIASVEDFEWGESYYHQDASAAKILETIQDLTKEFGRIQPSIADKIIALPVVGRLVGSLILRSAG